MTVISDAAIEAILSWSKSNTDLETQRVYVAKFAENLRGQRREIVNLSNQSDKFERQVLDLSRENDRLRRQLNEAKSAGARGL